MTDPNQNCPEEFSFFFQANPHLIRTCRRPDNFVGCASTTYATYGVEYSRVCGRIIAYQHHTTDAFRAYHRDNTLTIDSTYIDGVSLTYGQSPRQHIWSFASAFSENPNSDELSCPCIRSDRTFTGTIPPFIGEDYFCDTGVGGLNQFHAFDPIWDGQGCPSSSNACCQFNSPPWFCKQLPQPTTEDIELRICGSESNRSEGTPIEQIEIYIM